MDPKRLKELLENPETATSEDIPELESLISTYPYFQAARVILAKVTGTSESIKSAAAYTSDRTLLMRIINGTFDRDINLPNLNDLEIDDEVNAFEHLDQEEQEYDSIEENEQESTDENIDALLKSFEEEADEEESSDENEQSTSFTEEENLTSESENATEEDLEEQMEEEDNEDQENPFKNQGLSDFSTDDYKLPDYNYNFDSQNTESDEKEDEFTHETSELTWDDDTESTEKENTFEDFELKDISEEVEADPDKDKISDQFEDEDLFRNELMASLADLERIRKENADYDAKNEANEEQEETIEQENIEETEDIEEEIITEEVKAEEETSEEEATELRPSISVSVEDTKHHVIQNIKKTETISDTGPMFDDNLFELNNLIDTDKQIKTSKVKDAVHNEQKDMIDRFINTIPELTAKDHESREYSHLARDLYDRSIHADTSKMTETMAKLMITQGKLPRAIEIYEHLMLKYPEKKAYFAALIEKIRKDI